MTQWLLQVLGFLVLRTHFLTCNLFWNNKNKSLTISSIYVALMCRIGETIFCIFHLLLMLTIKAALLKQHTEQKMLLQHWQIQTPDQLKLQQSTHNTQLQLKNISLITDEGSIQLSTPWHNSPHGHKTHSLLGVLWLISIHKIKGYSKFSSTAFFGIYT